MINNQLLDYIKQQLSLNISRETITSNLKSVGWTEEDISEAFRTIIPLSTSVSVPSTPTISPTISPGVSNVAKPEIKTEFLKAKSKKGKVFAVILVLILLVLASGGAYAYYSGAFVSLPGLVSESIGNLKVTTSATYDTTVSIDFSGVQSLVSGVGQMLPGIGLTPSSKFIITTKGSYDVSDKNNPKSLAVISADFGTLSLAAELRVLNSTLYGELTKAPTIGFFPMFSSYENKWFSIPLKSENNQVANNSVGLLSVSSLSSVGTSILDKITPEQKDHLYQMFQNAHFVKTTQRFSPETINGVLSYHYGFDLDQAGISSYLQSLKEYVNTIGKDDSVLSAFDPTPISKSLDNLKDFKGEIWIGRSDKLPYKIMFNFGIQPDPTKDEQVKISIVGIMSGWNQPVSIVAPTDSVSFADLMSSLMSASLDSSRNTGKEAAIKANLSSIRAEAEIFYSQKNSYAGFCSSDYLKAARKEIGDVGGVGFVCKDTAQAFAVGTKFPDNAAGDWCVDSTGVSKATATLPSSTICPVK